MSRARSQERGLFTRCLVVVAAAALLAGCVPSEPGSPVAVRQASDKVEVLYVACTPKAVSAVQLVRPADQRQYILADSDPVNWAIHFANPTPLKRFVVGEVPDGATEDVRLANGLPPETYFAVRITLVDNSVKYACFRAKDLGDRVAFYGRYMPADEFARESKCD